MKFKDCCARKGSKNSYGYFSLLLLGLFFSLQVNAQGVLDQKINLNEKQVRLGAVLKQIEQLSGYTFVYNSAHIKADRIVTAVYKNQTLRFILHELLGDLADGVRVIDKQIYIRALPKGKASVFGEVKDEKGLPVPGAAVVFKGTSWGASTDSSGRFHIRDLKEGKHTVEVRSIGFEKKEIALTLAEGQQLQLNILLKEDQQQLKEIVVQGKTGIREIKESGFNVNAINAARFFNVSRDVNQLLNSTAGVRIRESGGLGSSFSFSINGLSGKAVRFFLDGIPMENYGTGMTLNNIPVNLAERLEVFKGVVPVELGADALGGAVNVVTNKGVKSYLDASYSYGSFNTHRASLSTQGLHKKTGILTKFTGFYNYSDNNYLMRNNPEYDAAIRVPDATQTRFEEVNVKRFHDQYKSAMAQGEVGVINKKWADVLMLSVLYNNHYKEFQTGATQNVVYGKVSRSGHFFMPSLRYKKDNLLVKGLSGTGFISYGIDKYSVADTSSYAYWWDGSQSPSGRNNGEFTGTTKTFNHFTNYFFLGRANLQYDLNAANTLTFNYNINRADRESHDDISKKVYDPAAITKTVYGLAWKNIWKDLTTTAFAKVFHFNVGVKSNSGTTGGTSESTDMSRKYNHYGYGLASRYAINGHAGVRMSYEQSYRLPEQIELLGDGVNIMSNLDLKPESSKNLNLGGDYTLRSGKHTYSVDMSGFLRNASNFIYSVPWSNTYARYLNEGKVFIYGAEAEAQYKYNNLLEFTLNATYQHSRQNQEYILGTKNKYVTYGNRIPNQPWLFGNAHVSIGKNNLLGEGSRIQAYWSSQYIHWFFLNWEAYGSSRSQNKIPTQFLQHAGVTASLKEGRYNFTVECRNLANQLAYDNFRLQKPGRSFEVKLRYFLQ